MAAIAKPATMPIDEAIKNGRNFRFPQRMLPFADLGNLDAAAADASSSRSFPMVDVIF
jgi:hypothetical protein